MLLNYGVGEDLESPLDCKEIQPVHPEGDQSRVFIGRTDAEAETPILWPPDAKNWLIWKDPDPGKDWGQEDKGMTEDEMAGWHHWLDGHQFGWTPGVGDGQGGLVWCDSWGFKESNTTEWLNWNWTELEIMPGHEWEHNPPHMCEISNETLQSWIQWSSVVSLWWRIQKTHPHFIDEALRLWVGQGSLD